MVDKLTYNDYEDIYELVLIDWEKDRGISAYILKYIDDNWKSDIIEYTKNTYDSMGPNSLLRIQMEEDLTRHIYSFMGKHIFNRFVQNRLEIKREVVISQILENE